MDQPGVDVRPIRMLSGETEFNEVYFDGAVTDAANVVGRPNDGWAVAMTLLGLERGDEAATNPILFRAELDRLLALATERGRTSDPVVRDRLADAYIRCEIMRYVGMRILTGVLHGDGTIGNEASISKLYWSEYHQRAARLAVEVLGADALVVEGRGPLRGAPDRRSRRARIRPGRGSGRCGTRPPGRSTRARRRCSGRSSPRRSSGSRRA